jgi:hypothetical protein
MKNALELKDFVLYTAALSEIEISMQQYYF